MAFPQKSVSGDIQLFRVDDPSTGSPDPSPIAIASVHSSIRPRSYHSVQLAIVTGLFACVGFVYSLSFVDSRDDFPQPHHWLRKSYNFPVMASPPPPPVARTVRQQSVPLKANQDRKTAALQRSPIASKLAAVPRRADRPTSAFRAVTDLRTKWTNFSANLRDRGDFARNLAVDFGQKLRQYRIEPGRRVVPDPTGKNSKNAG